MRPLPILSAVLLTAATPVFAQVTVDLHALQALPDHPPASHPSRGTAASAVRRPSRAEPAAPTTAAAPNHSSVAAREAPAAAPNQSSLAAREAPGPAVAIPPAAAQPAMPENVPPTAAIAPIAPPEPPPGAQPPPPPPVSDKAKTVAAPTTTGLRLTFAPGAVGPEPRKQRIDQATDRKPRRPAMRRPSTFWPMRPASRMIRPPRAGFRCRARWRCAAPWSPTACRPPASSCGRWVSNMATARPTGWTSA